MRPVSVTGIGLWSPGFASPGDWLRNRFDPDLTRPACSLLKSRIGRYTSLVTRMAVEALEQAAAEGSADLGQVPSVFGSAYGEIQIAFEQLDMIERDGIPSPARFKNSVHNTASGHVAIASGNMGFTTALAAGGATFAMSLLEAWAWLERHGGSILVAVADEPLPDHLSPTVGRYEALGVALHLVTEPAATNLGRLTWLGSRDGATTPVAEVPERLAKNPCSAALPLVTALLEKRDGVVPLEVGGDSWCVELHSGVGDGR